MKSSVQAAYHLLQIISTLLVIGTSTAVPHYAKPGCNDTCGNVRIPYPFGIGQNCSANQWYTIDCIIKKPHLSALNNLEILKVNLEQQTVTVNFSITTDCQNPVRDSNQILNVEFDDKSPFLFSGTHNKFVAEGCGHAVILDHQRSILTGCSTTCRNDTTVLGDKNNCLGITCCEKTLPYDLRSYGVDLTALESRAGSCGSAFLVDEKSYVEEGRFSSRSGSGDHWSHVPASLRWTLSSIDVYNQPCCNFTIASAMQVDLGNGNYIPSMKCDTFQPVKGNPYLSTGCEKEILSMEVEECVRCSDRGDSCGYDRTSDVDGLSDDEWNIACIPKPPGDAHENKSSLGVILGVSVSMSVLFLLAISYVVYNVFMKTKDMRRRRNFFKRNGGLLLRQQEKVDASLVDKTIIFPSHTLEKATDNFNENRILGRGGQGTVYKGMLEDGRIVAVKKSKIVDESQLEQFINEVVVLSQINHRNVVKLLGCCLETEVPLLVSEFISNGTLYDRLHNEIPFSLNMRLQIASEVAGAISYLHSTTSLPIYHRDIKTTNILLDDKYRAKVSDFGTSRFIKLDQTHLTTLVKGTFGYLDPEYFQSGQFTEKSDVYSFGVVLAELLTKEKPISLTRFGEHRSLVMHFTSAMEKGHVMSIFDAMVIKEGTRDELLRVANLAMHCLNENGMYRPTMKEVSIELEVIRISHVPCVVATPFI